MDSIGVYIHIPYCRSICPYCDFDRQAHGFDRLSAYVDALISHIERSEQYSLHSIFFGGGTPSLLEPEQVARILSACRQRFDWLDDAEVTLESNPGDLTASRVAGYREAGVNRMSLGVQNFDDTTLDLLGRRHSADEAREAFAAIRQGGIHNASLDLMYGLPGMTGHAWRVTLDAALALRPDHLSCYLLTLEERVPMGRDVQAGRLTLPEDDQVEQMYRHTMDRLEKAGFEHYEISNWAQPGRASRHNLTYWRDEPYLAFGSGAAGSMHGRRWKHHPSPDVYIRSVADGQPRTVEDERTDRATQIEDYIGLTLRLREGMDLTQFERRFDLALADVLGSELQALLSEGVLTLESGRLCISRDWVFVTNEVLARLLADVRVEDSALLQPVGEPQAY